MFSLLPEAATPANPILLILLTIVILVTIYLLIVIAETVLFQWMGWGDLRSCLKTVARINTVTFAAGVGLMLLIPKPSLWHLLAFLAITILFEAWWLQRIRPAQRKANWMTALVANLLSYLVLILPPFLRQ